MVLKMLKLVWLLMFAGRAFQVWGADAEKALSPNVHLNLTEGSCSNIPKCIEGNK